MKTGAIIGWIIVAIFVISIGSFVIGNCSRWVGNGVETAHQQFDPSALLAKYEWFKDASAQLDNKVANIQVYESELSGYQKDYGNNLSNYPRDIRETMEQHKSEMMGIINSYNSLASDYNSAMVKFNYKFCNVGTLPQGADTPLPREYKPYITKFSNN